MSVPAGGIPAIAGAELPIQIRTVVEAEGETALATAAFPAGVAALAVLALSADQAAEAARAAAVPVVHQAWAAPAAAGDAGRGTVMRFKALRLTAMVTAALLVLACTANVAHAQSGTEQHTTKPGEKGQPFDTPQKAADALIQAASNFDVSALLRIFGPDGKDFVSTADPVRDKNAAEAFAAKAKEKNKVSIDSTNPARAILSVGDDDWPLPIPIVRRNGKWYFDTREGHDEIVNRRIGANELDAIQICRGFVEAQKEYASQIHDNSGVNQYAQKIISTPGKQDGLYWQNPDGTPGGPIGEAVARAIQEGYSTENKSGYHGYYFKVLKGQGPAARLGQLDYVINGIMIGGFALAAVPAEYRVTGVKTFIVSYDGIVYERDLGPDSINVVKSMERYNPDQTWKITTDQWPADSLAASN